MKGLLLLAGDNATRSFELLETGPGVHVLVGGHRPFHLLVTEALDDEGRGRLRELVGHRVMVRFGERPPLRRRIAAVGGAGLEQVTPEALDLTAGLYGAAPLWLHADGTLASTEQGAAPRGLDALATMVSAARWISSRRTSSFERLFPASAFHPDEPERTERLDLDQGRALLDQLGDVLEAARVGREAATASTVEAAQLRSAALTVLSHLCATVTKDPQFRPVADAAAAKIFELIAAEQGPGSRPELRAHAINLLSLRGPALSEADRARAQALLRGMIRPAPPYDEYTGRWRFAVASAFAFNEGERDAFVEHHGFKKIPTPEGAPAAPRGRRYEVLESPFPGPDGEPFLVFTRAASPRDENQEMATPFFAGLLISRHAQLGAHDMTSSRIPATQAGYKLMMNAQCAGLTTRFAISRMFPEADIYSSWDSTYFRTNRDRKVVDSEGVDCFVALLQGLSARESFAEIDRRIGLAQWARPLNKIPGFVQFIGPAHPQVVARYEDINHDGKADYYDGFLDFTLVEIAEDARAGATPKDPGVAASQISGAAARGLGWAAGSLNRVTQYSELWDELPDQAERSHAFRAAGFFSPTEPPRDVDGAPLEELGRMPAVVRLIADPTAEGGVAADVMFNAWLSHAPQELKRLLCAAEAFWRAIDAKLLRAAPLDTHAGRRGALLLILAGLLEYPADQNRVDALWRAALAMLRMPPISRSLVRRCINKEDHDASNYYGSRRGIAELMGAGDEPGRLAKSDPVAHAILVSDDEDIGRAAPLELTADPPPSPAAPAGGRTK
ncbi:hypothetical protein [Enhygromyxa salina]|uniref:hypothetical protein n=1 Tax=Enhygromyxa salina TaxID=215803 RepID=UPI000D08ECB0